MLHILIYFFINSFKFNIFIHINLFLKVFIIIFNFNKKWILIITIIKGCAKILPRNSALHAEALPLFVLLLLSNLQMLMNQHPLSKYISRKTSYSALAEQNIQSPSLNQVHRRLVQEKD